AACTAAWEGANDEQIADRFLVHRDETFRLNYVLGNWQTSVLPLDQEEDWQFDDDQTTSRAPSPEEDLAVDDAQRQVLQRQLKDYIQSIRTLATTAGRRVNESLGVDVRSLKGSEGDAAQELFEEELEANAEFEELVSAVVEDICRRVEQLPSAGLKKTR